MLDTWMLRHMWSMKINSRISDITASAIAIVTLIVGTKVRSPVDWPSTVRSTRSA